MKLLKENPDGLRFNNQFLSRHDHDVYSFGYYQVEQYKINYKKGDYDIFKKKEIFLINKIDSHVILVNNYLIKNPEWQAIKFLKDSIDITGRFWKDSKVISIWPPDNGKITKKNLKQLINDIYLKTKIKITDDWNIEVENNKFKTIGKFLGRDMKMKYVDPSLRHILLPSLKNKKDVDGFGSDKYNKLAKKYGYNSVAQMNYQNKNKYFENLSLLNLIKTLI